jgi:integrase
MVKKKPPAYTLVKDAKVTGLFVRTTAAGVAAYVFDRRVKGKGKRRSRRVTIGRVKDWKLKAVRERARELAVSFDKGLDPRLEKKAQRAQADAAQIEAQRQGLVLAGVWPLYMGDCKRFWGDRHHRMHILLAAPGGRKKLKHGGAGTTKPGPLAMLMPLKLSDLTADRIAAWLRIEVAKRATNAHQSFRLLKTFIRWANEQPAYKGVIPPDACTHSKVVREVPSTKVKKNDCLQKQQLSAWFKAVGSGGNPVIAAYLQVLLLTGSRRNELATLKRDDVDFRSGTMLLRDKVEGERTIPLTPYVSQLLGALPKKNQWVFPAQSASGRVMEQRKAHNQALKAAALPHVSLHGLRRSFRTLSEWVEIPVGVIAQIQGHKPSATVEKHYVDRPLDLLRMHHAKLEAWILAEARVKWAPLAAGKRLGLVNKDGSVKGVTATA